MYRRHRYCTNDNPEWLDWTGIICGIGLLTALIAGAIAAESAPLTRKGAFCPIGYYRASAYCMPLQPTAPSAIPRTTKNCPVATYTQSNYCVSLERPN